MTVKINGLKLLSIILLALSPGWVSAEVQLRLAAKEHFKPFSWVENDEIKGIDVDISRELCRRANVECEILLLPWIRALNLVETGGLDGAIGAFKSAEREQYASYLNSPLHLTRQYVYVHKDNTFNFKSVADLNGLTIAKNRGFIISSDFDQALNDNEFLYEEFENNDINLLRLAYMRVDAVVGSERQMNTAIHRLNLQDRIVQLRTPLAMPRPSYLALSKAASISSTNPDIIDRLNAALQQIHEDGTVETITSSYDQNITIID